MTTNALAPAVFAAVDLGASGGRVMRGVVNGSSIEVEPVHRFSNQVEKVDGHFRWDASRLFEEIQVGLKRTGTVASVGVDSWGVDYGLLDAAGTLIAPPISYRDDRTAESVGEVHRRVPQDELYATTGVQYLPFNSIYQLAADQRGANWSRVRHAVMLPDLFVYWLTGELRTELTNASTTGMLDVQRREWSVPIFHRLELPHDLFPPIDIPGSSRGATADGTPVVAVGSHDTASAVAAVPATSERFAYISSGTWSLVGVELGSPLVTEDARRANFTNEVGVDGRTRFLRNVAGLWLLQECVRAWGEHDLAALLATAAAEADPQVRIDVSSPDFVAPDGMPERIANAAGAPDLSPAQLVRCILHSLADAYAETVHDAARLSGQPVDVVHIVGGGAKNQLLCQLTADAAGLPVIAGPVEATSVGNVLVQARAHGTVPESLDALRARLAESSALRRYEPS